MKITYRVDEEIRCATESNEDIGVEITRKGMSRSVSVTARKPLTLIAAEYALRMPLAETDRVFLNGYQSWTDTKEYTPKDKQNNLKRVPSFLVKKYSFDAAGDQSFYDFPLHTMHGFDLAYGLGEKEWFIGSRNYRQAYLIIELHTKRNQVILRADVEGCELQTGDSFPVYDFWLCPSVERGMEAFFAGMTARTQKKLFGYTSWYNHYQNINETIIENALEKADPRFELFQIDDGFETYVGDWFSVDEKKFPRGLAPIVDKIHERQMLAGVWLAPFVAEKKSRLFAEHPDWIARQADGTPIMAGPNWSGFCPLDINKPEVLDYIRRVLQEYKTLGFDFFKLDFLYATNLVRVPGKTRAQVSEAMYALLREALGDALILGCGAVVTAAFEKFDYMRVGPDVSLIFDDVFYMKHFHRERISTKVTLQNTIYRSVMNGRGFQNDPDVFLLRDENISLSREQRRALTMINAIFGSLLMTSDDPQTYDEEKKELLEEALRCFRQATKPEYCRDGDVIHVAYQLQGKKKRFDYHTEKGVLIHG